MWRGLVQGTSPIREGATEIAGIVIYSDDPLFLSVVAFHFLAGLVAVSAGLVAMPSPKGRGEGTGARLKRKGKGD